jgi:hypothetical protein
MSSTIGPVQLLVIGFAEPEFHGAIRAELERLREHDTIRLIDVIVVRKTADGEIERLQHTDLSAEEGEQLGAVVGALVGVGYAGEEGAEAGAALGAAMGEAGQFLPEEVWYLEDVLPVDTAVAVALLEHRWAIGLRDSIREAGGVHLMDAWVHPFDLVTIGLVAAEEAQQQIGA